MTIEEAVQAARKNAPVIYDDPMLGEMLFGRIGSIRKDFATLADAARGKAAETYALELLPMNPYVQSVMVVDAGRVRVAEGKDLRRREYYEGAPSRPAVRPELLCPEVRAQYEERRTP